MRLPPTNIDPDLTGFKYDEDIILEEIFDYIKETYKQHYSNQIQCAEFISSSGHGEGYFIGNIMKYADRYGKKAGHNEIDLFKIAHYTIMQIWEHRKRGY